MESEWMNEDGTPCALEDLPDYTCRNCQHKGRVDDLATHDDDIMFYCPVCNSEIGCGRL